MRQLTATISSEGHICTATVLVQKGAPLDLLLGTDLQTQLGFLFLQKKTNGTAVDLLQKRKWALTQADHEPEEEPVSPSCSKDYTTEEDNPLDAIDTDVEGSPVVRLIQAARLPSRHVKLVRARVLDPQARSVRVFEPEKEALKEKGLVIEDAVVEPDENRYVTLAIHNCSLHTVRLEGDHILGCLQEATILPTPSFAENQPNERDCTVKAVLTAPLPGEPDQNVNCEADVDRMTQLLKKLNWDSPVLTVEQKHQLKELLLQNGDLFALDPSELGVTNVVQHTINTGNSTPIRQQARRIPFALRSKVDSMTEEMLEQGVIQPSQSPWASPIVLVAKKDGTTRFCVDYRRLNAVTKLDVFPLPRVDDSLDLLAKYFSTLDLASGYWQVNMSPESIEKTAFATHSGLYEFAVMPFGLCNAPATFQRLMETVLAGLARDACMVYLDDILVLGATLEEHLQNLGQVFDRLRKAGLRLKPTKCHLAQKEIAYLGFIVTDKGVAADPQKIEAVRSYPTPTDLKHLRSFLGLASYYRRFIANFAKIANPLHALTCKDTPFLWDSTCQQAFESLKQCLIAAPVLAFPNFDNPFLMETDASGIGLGAVLAQKQEDGSVRPLAYASRSLQKHERNYGVTELEALAVVWGVKHFRPYLYVHRCDVYTDHEALKSLLNTPQPSGKLARWGMAIQELDLHIHYRPGGKNQNADALSRDPVAAWFPSATVPNADKPTVQLATVQVGEQSAKGGDDSLKERQRKDPELLQVILYLEGGVLPADDKRAREIALTHSQYEIVDSILYHVEKDHSIVWVWMCCNCLSLLVVTSMQ